MRDTYAAPPAPKCVPPHAIHEIVLAQLPPAMADAGEMRPGALLLAVL